MLRSAGWARVLAGVVALQLIPAHHAAAAAGSARRHLSLKRGEPAKAARLITPPSRISLWFTAKPELAFSRIQLLGPSGDVRLEPIVADTGNALHARVAGPLVPGAYTVRWQAGSADGHPIRGEYTFDVVASSVVPAADTAARVDTAATPTHEHLTEAMHRDDSGFRTARWLEFAALLSVLGTLGFRHGVLPPLAARGVPTADAADRARRLGLGMLLLYMIGAAIRAYTQSAAVYGADRALDVGALERLLTDTVWGAGWSVGVMGAVLVALGWAASKRSVTIGTPLALTGAFGMVLSPALSGHAASASYFILNVTVDAMHVAAAGLWIGGLSMVLFAGIPAMLRLTDGNPHAAVGALVSSFHPLALLCAPMAVLTGLALGWLRLGALGALLATPYGKTLLVKIGCVALVLAMGAYNSLRVRRTLGDADGSGTSRFRRTGSFELALGALVVAVTTFLVVTPLPSETLTP
jgi:copper transport protein